MDANTTTVELAPAPANEALAGLPAELQHLAAQGYALAVEAVAQW